MSEEEKKPEEAPAEPEEFVGFGQSWDDLEKNLKSDLESPPPDDEVIGEKRKMFTLSKIEIAEFAYNASIEFRGIVSAFEEDGEEIKSFDELSEEEQKEWGEIAGLAFQLQGDDKEDNFARLVHAKTSMGLLKEGIVFNEKFTYLGDSSAPVGSLASPLVAPWECLPHERRIPLLIFKGVCKQLYRLWDRDNDILKR